MNVYFLKTNLAVDEILEKLKRFKGHAVVIRPETAALNKALDYSYFLALKSFSEGRAKARTFCLEWISKLACTGNISSALKLCLPKGRKAALASDLAINKRILRSIGVEYKPRFERKTLNKLAKEYGISSTALKNHFLEDLVVEQIALANIE